MAAASALRSLQGSQAVTDVTETVSFVNHNMVLINFRSRVPGQALCKLIPWLA